MTYLERQMQMFDVPYTEKHPCLLTSKIATVTYKIVSEVAAP